jgi:hypothetical protein
VSSTGQRSAPSNAVAYTTPPDTTPPSALARTAIGYTDEIVYCQTTGANTIAVRAMDTSGNVSPFSNEIVFDC